MKRLVYAAIKNMHGNVNNNDYKTGYLYLLKHGIGPGTLPKDVTVLKSVDLPHYWTAVWLDSVLTADELKEYDIPSETQIQRRLADLGYMINDQKELVPVESARSITASIENSLSGKDMIATLDSMEIGTPLLINPGTGDYIQALYAGQSEIQSQIAYQFFDGSGVDGTFGQTKRFIMNNQDRVSIILNDNDPSAVAELTSQFKDVEASSTIKCTTESTGWQNVGDVNPYEFGRFIKDNGDNTYSVLMIDPGYKDDQYFAMWLTFDMWDVDDGWMEDRLIEVANYMGYDSVEAYRQDVGIDGIILGCIDYFRPENFNPVCLGDSYEVPKAIVEDALASIGF